MMRECEWTSIKSNLELKSPFSKFFLHENITESEILTEVMKKEWFGLLSVDIFTPDDVKNRFRNINFGTLFEKLSVTEDMLSDFQKNLCFDLKRKFPLKPQLSGFDIT